MEDNISYSQRWALETGNNKRLGRSALKTAS
jgi:hypothetical protein